MAHNIYRLASTILNNPQLIQQEAFEPIAEYLRYRSSKAFLMEDQEDYPEKEKDDEEEEDFEIVGGIAIIKVEGPLTYKTQRMMCQPDTISYEALIEQTEEAIEQGCKAIVYEHSSPGGQAFFCFQAADEISRLLTENNIKSYAYILEGSYSASYALACICDEVIINPDASCGNIGCCVSVKDVSKSNEMNGIKPIYKSFPEGKVPFEDDGSFKKSFLDKLEEDAVRLGTQFAEHVSKYTGLSVETILGLDAQTFYAEKALEIGLVNKIMTQGDFINYITNNRSI